MDLMLPTLVALVGQTQSGKSTIAGILSNKYEYRVAEVGGPARTAAKAFGWSGDPNEPHWRETMAGITHLVEWHHPGLLLQTLIKRSNQEAPGVPLVLVGIRQPSFYLTAKALGADIWLLIGRGKFTEGDLTSGLLVTLSQAKQDAGAIIDTSMPLTRLPQAIQHSLEGYQIRARHRQEADGEGV